MVEFVLLAVCGKSKLKPSQGSTFLKMVERGVEMQKSLVRIVLQLGKAVYVALFLTSAAIPTLADSSEDRTANIERFCREAFGIDAVAGFDRRDGGVLCSVGSVGGLSRVHYRINPGDICAEQFGTRRFRREGSEVFCQDDDEVARDGKSIDLAEYCRAAHGHEAFVTRRTADNQPLCTLRTPGGLGLNHFEIDLASLCGNAQPRVEGTTLHCDARATAEPAAPGDTEASMPETARGEETANAAEIARRPATGNLDGCGIFGGGIRFAELIGSDEGSLREGRIAFPCQGLSGGWDGDLVGLCREFAAGVGMQSGLEWRGHSPVCFTIGADGIRHEVTPPLAAVPCARSFADLTGESLMPTGSEPGYLNREGNVTLVYRLYAQKLRCFVVPRENVKCYGAFLADGHYPPDCVAQATAAELDSIEFVAAEPPFHRIDRLTIGRSFRVRLVFTEDPGRRSEPVTVRNDETGEKVELMAEQTEDLRVFVTPPVTLQGEVAP